MHFSEQNCTWPHCLIQRVVNFLVIAKLSTASELENFAKYYGCAFNFYLLIVPDDIIVKRG